LRESDREETLATSQKGRGWRGVRTPPENGRSNEREPGDTGGPINTGLRQVAGWRQHKPSREAEGAAREGGAANKQPRKPKAPGLRGKKRFHTA
jgi:hypothetical protein